MRAGKGRRAGNGGKDKEVTEEKKGQWEKPTGNGFGVGKVEARAEKWRNRDPAKDNFAGQKKRPSLRGKSNAIPLAPKGSCDADRTRDRRGDLAMQG